MRNYHQQKILPLKKLNLEVMNELKIIKELEQSMIEEKCLQRIQKTYDFTKFKTISSFGDAIKNDIITMVMVNDE